MSDFLKLLNPEERLLISLCRLEFSIEKRSEISDHIKAVNNWNEFFQKANAHGIVALCHHNLENLGYSGEIPDNIRKMLYSGYMKSLARNTLMSKISDEIASIARTENLKIVLLKGSALERTIYGQKGLRQMFDIDILVEKDKAMKLRTILIENGFIPAPFISKIYEKKLFVEGKHLPELTKSGITVEIHFRLFNETENSLTAELFDSSIAYHEGNSYYPSPQWHFLYLVKHLRKHEAEGSSQLRLYTDLALLLYSNTEINIEKLYESARLAGIEKILLETLEILKDFWNLTIPGFSSETIQPDYHKFISFIKTPEGNVALKSKNNPLRSLRYISGIRNKILFVTGYIFPSREYLRYRYDYRSKDTILVLYINWWKVNLLRVFR